MKAPLKIPSGALNRLESGRRDTGIRGTSDGPNGLFFDIANRYAGLDAKNDPLVKIDEVVPWEDFRPRLEAAWRKPAEDRKSPAGRKPWDALVMFKAIVLCALYNLSDDQVEYQLRDRLSFMRFLGLGLEDRVPDAKTVWLYREHLAQAGVIEALFDASDGSLKKRGYLAMGGQIIDASIVPVPQQRNSRDENARIKDGETPEGWEKQPAKRRQKDTVTLTPNSGPGGSSPMRPERWSCPSWPVPASGSRCSSGAVVGYRRSRCTRIAQPWPRVG